MKYFLRLSCLTIALLPLFSVSAQQDSLPSREVLVDTAKTEYQKKDSSALKEYSEAYYKLKHLNKGLESPEHIINLQTPQATMEHFILSCREGDFERAAHALNLNLLPQKVQLKEATILAKKLHYVIDKRVKLDWSKFPDRPDAQINQAFAGTKAIAGKPRRSLGFGTLSVDGREIELSLQRVKIDDKAPIWVISANTVENIEELYKKYGPTKLDRWIPEWGEFEIVGISAWKIIGLLLLGALCYLLFKGLSYLIKQFAKRSDEKWVEEISHKGATPIAMAASVLTFYLVMNNFLSVSGGFSPYFYSILLVIVVGAVTWVIMRAIDYFMDRFAEQSVGDISEEENLQSRRYLTYISVARRIITFIVIIIGIGIVMSQFESLQKLGISLMASAGVATIVLGIAAQSTLGNIIAGMQIAITKPARIGDTVLFEGQYGTIENIRFTYLVISTWDERRVVVPLKYFITNPFENWSMNDPHLMKPISLFLDHTVDVEKVRQKFAELLKASDDYDEEKPPKVQVVDSSKEAIEVRALCSAKDPSTAWDLHCKIREELIAYVSDLQGGSYLAKERVELKRANEHEAV